MQQPGLAGLGSGLPTLPFPSGLQAAEAVSDGQRAAGQRERRGEDGGSGYPTGTPPRPFRHMLQGRTVWGSTEGPSLACAANQLLVFLKDCGDSLTDLGHLGSNSSHGIVLGQLRGQQRRDCTPGLPVGCKRRCKRSRLWKDWMLIPFKVWGRHSARSHASVAALSGSQRPLF